MTVLNLSEKDKQVLRDCGLEVTKTTVSGKLTSTVNKPIVKAYEHSLEYESRFTFTWVTYHVLRK